MGTSSSDLCNSSWELHYEVHGASDCTICMNGIHFEKKDYSTTGLAHSKAFVYMPENVQLLGVFTSVIHVSVSYRVVISEAESANQGQLLWPIILTLDLEDIANYSVTCCNIITVYACLEKNCLTERKRKLGSFSFSDLPVLYKTRCATKKIQISTDGYGSDAAFCCSGDSDCDSVPDNNSMPHATRRSNSRSPSSPGMSEAAYKLTQPNDERATTFLKVPITLKNLSDLMSTAISPFNRKKARISPARGVFEAFSTFSDDASANFSRSTIPSKLLKQSDRRHSLSLRNKIEAWGSLIAVPGDTSAFPFDFNFIVADVKRVSFPKKSISSRSRSMEIDGSHFLSLLCPGLTEILDKCDDHKHITSKADSIRTLNQIRSVISTAPNVNYPQTETSRLKNQRRVLTSDQDAAQIAELQCSSIVCHHLCGENNSALFGLCIASGYRDMQISSSVSLVYSGLPFTIYITKKDSYNQTILSDSSSLIQILPMLGNNMASSSMVSVIGSSVAKLDQGVASVRFGVMPRFSNVNFMKGTAYVFALTTIIVEGFDSQSSSESYMRSDSFVLNIQQGTTVCPPGYIFKFVLEQDNATEGMASCKFCESGTYSIQPLAYQSGAATNENQVDFIPLCFTCPNGADCSKGGSEVYFSIGTWSNLGGMYFLIGCPEGFQLINSTSGTSSGSFSNRNQECRKCGAGQYIINPNTDQCNQCPPGKLAIPTLEKFIQFTRF